MTKRRAPEPKDDRFEKLKQLAWQVRLACNSRANKGMEPYVDRATLIGLMVNIFPIDELGIAFKLAEEAGYIRRVAGTQGESTLSTIGNNPGNLNQWPTYAS